MSDKPHTLINSIEPVFVPDELAPNPDPVGTVKWNEQPTHDPDWAETWNKKRVGFLGYDYAEADDEMANLVLKSELDAALARIKDLERLLERDRFEANVTETERRIKELEAKLKDARG